MQDLRVSILQVPLEWEAPQANRAAFSRRFDDLPASDLVVMPEMFTTGFSMKATEVPESHGLTGMVTLDWMRTEAQRLNAALTGSVAVSDKGIFFNRMYWVEPDGKVVWYDKRHLFTFAGEDRSFSAGTTRVVTEWRGWRIMLQVCYDLRFPEGARNSVADGRAHYDALIYVANWPEVRRDAWSSLLTARAIENQCFVVGANRCGTDGNGIAYTGDSAIIDPKGSYLAQAPEGEDATLRATLKFDELSEFRTKFPVLFDRID